MEDTGAVALHWRHPLPSECSAGTGADAQARETRFPANQLFADGACSGTTSVAFGPGAWRGSDCQSPVRGGRFVRTGPWANAARFCGAVRLHFMGTVFPEMDHRASGG